MKHILTIALAGLALMAWQPVVAISEDAPRTLKWAELRPPKAPAALSPNKSFSAGSAKVEGAPAADDTEPAPPPSAEGKFMSMKKRQPGGDKPPAIVPELNGQRISIGGYIVPLDFESTTIKEFLLVPFVGACIHVPPPPANQIIFVTSATGIEITGQFDPVTVTGTIKTETAFTGLADAGYSLAAETVTLVKQ